MSRTSQGKKSRKIIQLGTEALQETTRDQVRVTHMQYLGAKIDKMLDLVYGYTDIEDDLLDTDDEIINWTFVDVSDDLEQIANQLMA